TYSTEIEATRRFKIDDIFYLQGLPLIYSITLVVEDGDYFNLVGYRLGIIPKKYTFYFSSKELKLEKPAIHMDKLTVAAGKFRDVQELEYTLKESIFIQKCNWNLTIYLDKARFAFLNKISACFYDGDGREIMIKEKTLNTNLFQDKEFVQIKGSFDGEEEFKSVKIALYGFSLKDKINILYGGDKASHLCFDFSN
ncbi:MAG: hypothetical protein JSW62_05550, partial [Thermoplasmatales archaeon]